MAGLTVFQTKYFLDVVRKYPPFSSKDEEMDLRQSASGDMSAIADELVLRHVALAASLASKWTWAIPPEDALSIAVAALYSAFRRFDFARWKFVRFETFAYPVVKTALRRAVRLYLSPVDRRSISADAPVAVANSDGVVDSEVPALEWAGVTSRLSPEVRESMSRGPEETDLARWVASLVRIGGGALAAREIELIMTRFWSGGCGETGVSRQAEAVRLARARRHLAEGLRRTMANAFRLNGVGEKEAAAAFARASDELLTDAFKRKFEGGRPAKLSASRIKRTADRKKLRRRLREKIKRQARRQA